MFFCSILDYFLDAPNLEMCVFPKEKPYFSQNHHVAKNLILGSLLEPFSYHFSNILQEFFNLFSTSIFVSIFYRFLKNFALKWDPNFPLAGTECALRIDFVAKSRSKMRAPKNDEFLEGGSWNFDSPGSPVNYR